ncbi:MAG: RNA polymerase sigma factor [Myxococcota bacterium]|nr:RNA polymerase sigma factor [Myxococcota bacterium]
MPIHCSIDEFAAPELSLSNCSDEELLAGLKDGSEHHFSELYNRYFQRIYSFSYVRVRNHADAEEIAQETFMAVFRSAEAYRGQSALLSWIYGIAKNTANNHLRRIKSQETRLEDADHEMIAPRSSIEACRPDEQLDLHQYVDSLASKLENLADWQLDVFRMRHFENLSIPEICDRTERTSDAIRSCLCRVKRLFFDASEGLEARAS